MNFFNTSSGSSGGIVVWASLLEAKFVTMVFAFINVGSSVVSKTLCLADQCGPVTWGRPSKRNWRA